MKLDAPKVAVVTGASRGVGRGIARALGAKGMTVYVTGRSTTTSLGCLGRQPLSGTIHETAREIDQLGGRGIAVGCDHGDDAAVQALFAQVATETGRLDILVNNATYLHDSLIDRGGFWERPLELAGILNVGLRSGYVASYYAAPLMVRQRHGLIAFTSSYGGACYMHGPAYGAQKAGVDKFAADMAVELQEHHVAAVSLWLGPQQTERTAVAMALRPGTYEEFMAQAETPEFNGRVLHALACDPDLMSLTGMTHIAAELAERYAITDSDGQVRPSYRQFLGAPRVAHPAIVQ